MSSPLLTPVEEWQSRAVIGSYEEEKTTKEHTTEDQWKGLITIADWSPAKIYVEGKRSKKVIIVGLNLPAKASEENNKALNLNWI